MRQSRLLGTIQRNVPKDEVATNAQLLIRAGFVHKEMAGVYSYLPLGLRVLKKIENIIREEINAIGGQELFMTTLQDPAIWKTTNRWDDKVVDNWFKTSLKSGAELGIANTHEEALTNLLRDHMTSYKDLPLYAYQFQTKFRNELRAKSGILRGREFLMKDLYSYSIDEASFRIFYEECASAYMRIFTRVGLGDRTYRTFASGGSFSKFSDEFQTLCDAGEDLIYLDEVKKIAVNKEVYTDEILADLHLDKNTLVEKKAIEVGNIFPLADRFTKALGLSVKNKNGENIHPYMGCYGIGLGRVMGTIAEVHHDDQGLQWPESVAPYQIHLIPISKNPLILERAEHLYHLCIERGIEVLLDDRTHQSTGQRLTECDLMGIPHRVILSEKTGDDVEWHDRSTGHSSILTIDAFWKKLDRQNP